jgi:ankyrin repeat protein
MYCVVMFSSYISWVTIPARCLFVAQHGFTALHYAVARAHAKTVKALIDRGASVLIKSNVGSAFFFCYAKGYCSLSHILTNVNREA